MLFKRLNYMYLYKVPTSMNEDNTWYNSSNFKYNNQ